MNSLFQGDSEGRVWDVVDVVEWVVGAPVQGHPVAPHSGRASHRVLPHRHDNVPFIITAKIMLRAPRINIQKIFRIRKLQIFDQKFKKCYPLRILVQVSVITPLVWALVPGKWKIIEFETTRVNRRRKLKICLLKVPPCIFKINYLPVFGLYSQAETTGVITETDGWI